VQNHAHSLSVTGVQSKYTHFDPLVRTMSSVDGNGGSTSFVYSRNDAQTTVGPAPSGEHLKQTQVEYDGLGRVKSTCSLETSGGTSCGQAMGGSGVLTSNTYSFGSGSSTVVTARGVQSRTVVKDALRSAYV